MSLTTRNLSKYLSELGDHGWDYRLVAGFVDGAWQLWVATYTTDGQYTGEALLVLLRSGQPRRMTRKGSVECYAQRHGLLDRLVFREGAL